MGASQEITKLLKSMQHMTWFQRDEALEKVAQDYGEGFAKVVRGELAKRIQPQEPS